MRGIEYSLRKTFGVVSALRMTQGFRRRLVWWSIVMVWILVNVLWMRLLKVPRLRAGIGCV